ncbi:MAG: DUF4190 domain-containing protein [Candidatus Gastranaerophilales bacterium]|nr:DUF4190 domain-containing protein [Candidatus Gastranaerophilales bacterium]
MEYSGGQYNNMRNRSVDGFAVASMICGVLSLVLCCSALLSLALGAMGILFAVLSNRKGKAMPGMSIAGISTSIVGMALGLFMSFYYIFAAMLPGMLRQPEFRDQMDSLYEEAYGMDMDEFMERFYGMDLDEFLDNF